jgi:tRNA-splicing ligase RtcB (3'-phosphate/5'-hydroxy nucleic acid ligase)
MKSIFGTHQDNTLAQFEDVSSRAVHSALMADGHLGYVMPIGGVAAYRDHVSVVGVGFDIACGNAAIRTDMHIDELISHWGRSLEQIATDIQRNISFGVGRKNDSDDAPTDHHMFDSPVWDALPRGANSHNLKGKARSQLGTVGSGNHYVDVFVDENGYVWVGVHFGSRGFGHTVASGFLSLAQGKEWGERVPETETLLNIHDGGIGEAYWALMNLAGQYAYTGREWVARKVVQMLGAGEKELIHNHHNFAWREEHFGENLIVVRKGATPAFPGQKGFVGGSMGDNAVILEGTRLPHPGDGSNMEADRWALDVYYSQQDALYSTVHGAGRVMSRSEAAGNRKGTRPGKITPEMMKDWLFEKGVILRGGGLDEAPQAYRRLPDVLAAQGDTINVLHNLKPIIVVMAGANEFDPYKD